VATATTEASILFATCKMKQMHWLKSVFTVKITIMFSFSGIQNRQQNT